MLTTYLRHLHRDRRRIVLAVSLLLLTVDVAFQTLPRISDVVPTEAVIAAALLVLIPVVTLLAPRHRHWIEVFAVADLIYAVLARVAPGSPWDYYDLRGSLPLNTIAYVATVWATRVVLYGKWSDRFVPRRHFSVTTHFHSSAPLRDLWYGMIATPGRLDRYADPEVVSADFCNPEHSAVRLVTWHPGRPAGEWLVHYEDLKMFEYARLRLTVRQGLRNVGLNGATTMEFRDTGRDRVITVRLDAPALAPRRLLRAWLDDTLGRAMDRRIRAIEQGLVGRHSPVRDKYSDWFDEPEHVDEREDDGSSYRAAYGRSLSAGELAVIEGFERTSPANSGRSPAKTAA